LVSDVIELNDEKYRLLWYWDTKQGQVNVKLAYEVQVMEDRGVEPKFQYSKI